ncbi:hypothetical protein Tco_1162817 [Tanacetum coccineum]
MESSKSDLSRLRPDVIEQELIRDVKENLYTLQKVNIKLNPNECMFGMEEGRFLGYMVTAEGIMDDPEKRRAMFDRPSQNKPEQIRSLCLRQADLG